MNPYTSFWIMLVLGIIFIPSLASTQNLEEFGVKKGLKISGSLNLNTIAYTANGLEGRREPFTWFASGNLNIQLFGYNAPFSFSYSNTQRNFAQPFNQLRFSPRYKWVQLHGGYTSMTFSPYTLSGHIFLGAGIELSPGKWRIAAMYGRLRKAVPFNLVDSSANANASFERRGWGIKFGREGSKTNWDMNIFTAKDDPNSLPFVPLTSEISPEQNLALGFHIRQNLGNNIFTEVTYSLSVLNRDRSADNDSLALNPESKNFLAGLLPNNSTSRSFDAVNASLGYQGRFYSLSLQYERVAPEYRTLGAYFFNNDLRNITIAPQVQLFKNRLTLASNLGLGRNNLDESRGATTKRFVSSLNVNYTPSAHWNFTGAYSNFSTFINRRPQTDPFFQDNLDTLNFFQVNHSFTTGISHQFGKQAYQQSLLFSAAYQRANSETSSETDINNLSNFYSFNFAYSLRNQPQDRTWSLAFNYYLSEAAGLSSIFLGPSLSLSQAFLNKRLQASLTSAYNRNQTKGQAESNDVWNTRLNLNYSPPSSENQSGKHRLSINMNLLKRFGQSAESSGFTEFTTTMGYSYSF